ncbi:hypothetical protein NDU88_003525 [Pleurodeles waltl]|uniref:Secreted protein n=1 Tax=Pleurodeles waltl TaxID=8319 RepID=A0AAV7W5W2_PLEWA|nr:hypothetical protein NDU88_003525 [Pleurodeles waltl]
MQRARQPAEVYGAWALLARGVASGPAASPPQALTELRTAVHPGAGTKREPGTSRPLHISTKKLDTIFQPSNPCEIH